jgi:dTDP-4-dehydrorhamnose reductase
VRILLAGKHGQLGHELERTLATIGDLSAFDRVGFDLTQPNDFKAQVRALRPQIIVNAAAYTAVDRAESESALAYDVNALAPGILAEEAKRLDALLVHFSTDYVFDGSLTRPYLEGDTPSPQSVYGTSKLDGERAIQASGCRHLILRISWVYGTHGANFPKTILKLAKSQSMLRVVNDQWGAPTNAGRVASVLRDLLLLIHSRPSIYSQSPGLYHLSPAGCVNWYEFALEIVTRNGLTVPVYPTTSESFVRPAKRPANSLMDNSKFLKDFQLSLGHWRNGFDDVSTLLSSN